MVRGRARERAAAGRLVAAAADGDGGALWLVGEPGLGKTTLVDAVVAEVVGPRVLRVAGRQTDDAVGWQALGELLGGLVDDPSIATLPEGWQWALLVALGRRAPTREGPVEPLAVLEAVTALLRVAATDGGVVVVVDDAQWLDDPSRLVVDHLVRRSGHGVAVIVAGRPERRPPPVTPIVLGPLDRPEALALLADLEVTAGEVAGRLVDDLGGVPLLLVAAAAGLTPAQRAGRAPMPEVLPVPGEVLALAGHRLADVADDGCLALALVARLPTRDLATVVRALDRAGVAANVLVELEGDGLLAVSEAEVALAHPTIATAAHRRLSSAARRSMHRALAEVHTEPSARAWHHGLAAIAPDAGVAAELGAAAVELSSQGAPLEAARLWELAARLTPDPSAAAVRLHQAAEAAAEAGEDQQARGLLDRAALSGPATADEAWRRRWLGLRLDLRTGDIDAPVQALRGLAEEVGPTAPALAAAILLDAAAPLVRTIRLGELAEVAAAADGLARRAGDERLGRRARVCRGIAGMATGAPDATTDLEAYREVLAVEGPAGAGVFLAEVVAPALAVFRGPEGDALMEELTADLRARAAAPGLVAVLGARAIATQTRDLRLAVAHAREAMDLATAIGRPALGRMPALSLVLAAGLAGDRDACLAAHDLLVASDEPLLVQGGLIGLGALHLTLGELDDALDCYGRLREEFGPGAGVTRWEPEWCEVLVRSGRRGEAATALAEAERVPTAWLAEGPLDRVRGLLAEDPDEADARFEAAVGWFVAVGNRMGEARTELCWGERCRRARRRGRARRHLERAVELFASLQADVWADRARAEARMAGAVTSGRPDRTELSERELEVARLAVTGATNQEIGVRLFLSPRTVEGHLGAVFRKLGVANRRQLAALAVGQPWLRAEHGVSRIDPEPGGADPRR